MSYKSIYFQDKEFEDKSGAKSPYPHVVQDELYNLLDRIRAAYGSPVVITCGYRCEKHNEEVGGVSNSFHMKGMAADIRPLAKDMNHLETLYFYAKLCNNNGGVGWYPNRKFVHVDCRGYAARWVDLS